MGALLLTVSIVSSAMNLIVGVDRLADLESFDFAIRVGGRLQEPHSEDDAYPLTHSMYVPGNTTIAIITNVSVFSIFYQVVLGIGLLDNGSQTTNPAPKAEGARYDILLNLTTNIQIDTPEGQRVEPLDLITNFYLNESTAQQVILPKGIDMGIVETGTAVEFAYYLTRTLNNDTLPTSEIVLTSAFFRVLLVETMNVSLVSEWTARFISPGASDVAYSGDEAVGEFYIDKTPDSSCTLNGLLRCFFGEQHVNVLTRWVPLYEVVVGATGAALVLLSIRYLHRDSEDHSQESSVSETQSGSNNT